MPTQRISQNVSETNRSRTPSTPTRGIKFHHRADASNTTNRIPLVLDPRSPFRCERIWRYDMRERGGFSSTSNRNENQTRVSKLAREAQRETERQADRQTDRRTDRRTWTGLERGNANAAYSDGRSVGRGLLSGVVRSQINGESCSFH